MRVGPRPSRPLSSFAGLAAVALLANGCALGLGRLTPSPEAGMNSDSQSLRASGDQSGVPIGMVRVQPVTEAKVDTSDSFHLGAQAGIKAGRALGSSGGLPMASSWSYDPHVDVVATASRFGVAVSASWLWQQLEYAGGFMNGYQGPAASLLGMFSPVESLGLFAGGGPVLGEVTVGGLEKPDRYGRASAPGWRAQAGLDWEPAKSGTVGMGVRVEFSWVHGAGPTPVRGLPSTWDAGSALLELYFMFLP